MKNTDVFMSSSGNSEIYMNGNLVQDIDYNAEYDGDRANLYLKHNDDEYYTQLNNNDIMNLLSMPSSNQSLIARLEHDFPLKKTDTSSRKTSGKTSGKTKSKNKKKTKNNTKKKKKKN